jgi:hypothetical protein
MSAAIFTRPLPEGRLIARFSGVIQQLDDPHATGLVERTKLEHNGRNPYRDSV